jgi:hypothetical protein
VAALSPRRRPNPSKRARDAIDSSFEHSKLGHDRSHRVIGALEAAVIVNNAFDTSLSVDRYRHGRMIRRPIRTEWRPFELVGERKESDALSFALKKKKSLWAHGISSGATGVPGIQRQESDTAAQIQSEIVCRASTITPRSLEGCSLGAAPQDYG